VQVTLADGSQSISHGKATCDCLHPLSLEAEILPQFTNNLLSVNALVEADGEAHMTKLQSYIQTPEGTRIPVQRKDETFIVEPPDPQPVQKKRSGNMSLFHKRLGHIGVKKIRAMLKDRGITLKGAKSMPPCAPCRLHKSAKRRIHRQARASQRSGTVYADVWGPVEVPSIGGNKYVIAFVNEKTRHRRLFFLKKKSGKAVATALQTYILEIGKYRIKTVKVHSDQGEFKTPKVIQACRQLGIQRSFSAPYHKEQNGPVERSWRYLGDLANTMMADAGVGGKLWGEALATAEIVTNAAPSAGHGDLSPNQLSNISDHHLLERVRSWGCLAFVHDNRRKGKGKLSPKAKRGILIGYAKDSPAWRILLDNGRIVESLDVTFDEGTFPAKQAGFVAAHIPFGGLEKNADGPIIEDEGEEAPDDPVAANAAHVTPGCPRNYKEAVKQKEWRQAITTQLTAMQHKKVWEEIPRTDIPKGEFIYSSIYVFKEKANGTKTARLCVLGNQSTADHTNFSPTGKGASLRLTLKYAAQNNLPVHRLDAKGAFLNASRQKPGYMNFPQGYRSRSGATSATHVLKVTKSLYGFRESPKEWYDELSHCLLKMGYKRCRSDPCLFKKEGSLVWLYVDDCIVASSTKEFQAFSNAIPYDLSACGVATSVIGLEIERDTKGGFQVHQQAYIEELLQVYDIKHPSPTPGVKKVSNPDETPMEVTKYRAFYWGHFCFLHAPLVLTSHFKWGQLPVTAVALPRVIMLS
jgi:transposase InsO family protein